MLTLLGIGITLWVASVMWKLLKRAGLIALGLLSVAACKGGII